MQLANEARLVPGTSANDRWARGASAFSIPGVLTGLGVLLYRADLVDISTFPQSLGTLLDFGMVGSMFATLFAPLSTLVALVFAIAASAPPRAAKRVLRRMWFEVSVGMAGTGIAWVMLLKNMSND